MDRPSSDLHLVLCLLALLCIHGKGQVVTGLNPPCETQMMVQRGTVWKAVPQQHLTINCTMKYCREPPHVIWCKLQDTDTCAPVNDTGNIGTRQTDFYDKNKLISFLNFKPVSIHDEGLYRCETKGSVYLLSHTINVTFSDVSPDSPNVSDDEVSSLPWLPYIIISISVVLLVFIVIVATLLSFYRCNRLMNNQTKGEEISTLMLPDIPKDTIPSAPVLQAHMSNLYDNYPRNNTGTSHSLMTGGSRPVESTAGEDQRSGYLVYATLNHPPSGTPVRAPHTTTQQDEHTDYAAIRFS
ncbi:B- and T-lymphocyte attenuator-like [Myripristis murdjan]|uniref:B- and T-lymphocyte attenuator-like n=1 Tax=Myripristis murdjan TaxID=586833 RepID=UPI001175EEF0|nr:B- and T-lymphocyte attenuator [Myripristis murdjan]